MRFFSAQTVTFQRFSASFSFEAPAPTPSPEPPNHTLCPTQATHQLSNKQTRLFFGEGIQESLRRHQEEEPKLSG